MSLLAALRARLGPAPVPPRCGACRQDEIALEYLGASRWFCAVCAKDFQAVLDGEDWRIDLTPPRYRRRG